MKKARSKQPIDCVALKRRAQEKIHADTEHMSIAEQIDYFRRRAGSGALGAWWKRVANVTVDAPALVAREKPGRYGK